MEHFSASLNFLDHSPNLLEEINSITTLVRHEQAIKFFGLTIVICKKNIVDINYTLFNRVLEKKYNIYYKYMCIYFVDMCKIHTFTNIHTLSF